MKEFAKRRQSLMRQMGQGGVAILSAAPVRLRNRDVYYPYRQESSFYYLTGFNEPDAVMVIAPGREHGEYILFCRERDPEKETWDGARAGQEGAIEIYGADDSFPICDINDILPGIIEGHEKLYCTMGIDPDFDKRVMGWINHIREQGRSGSVPPQEIVALDHVVNEMRLFKSASEKKLMQRAAEVSAKAHISAMQVCRPGMYEYEIEAEFLKVFRQHNCEPAYSSIIAGGKNGCVLHYVENQDQLKDGDLLLIDAGAEHELYAGDISRTFPVNGRFSPEQRAVYDIVLASQYAAIDAVKPDNHWDQPHQEVVKILTQGLVDLGILKGSVSSLIEEEAYKPFFMHRTGHWLGMDVHDVGDYKIHNQWRVLEPGMVTTIEPGLYITAQDGVDPKWHNIGIRIEDDVLVTRSGNKVLSAKAPKEPGDIEAIMAA